MEAQDRDTTPEDLKLKDPGFTEVEARDSEAKIDALQQGANVAGEDAGQKKAFNPDKDA